MGVQISGSGQVQTTHLMLHMLVSIQRMHISLEILIRETVPPLQNPTPSLQDLKLPKHLSYCYLDRTN